MSRMLSARGEQPGQADLGRCRTEPCRHPLHVGVVDDLGHPGERRTQREVRDERDLGGDAPGEHTAVVSGQQAVRVLDARDLRQGDRFVHLGERRGRDADAGDLALLAQRHHLTELIGERHPLLVGDVQLEHPAQVDRAELPHAERTEVVLHAGTQLGRRLRRVPPAGVVADRPDLGHDDEVVGVRVQGLADQLVGDVRPVVLGRVDVVDAGLDGPAQHGDRFVVVARRAQHAGTGQLHRAEADAPDGSACDPERRRAIAPTVPAAWLPGPLAEPASASLEDVRAWRTPDQVPASNWGCFGTARPVPSLFDGDEVVGTPSPPTNTTDFTVTPPATNHQGRASARGRRIGSRRSVIASTAGRVVDGEESMLGAVRRDATTHAVATIAAARRKSITGSAQPRGR